MRRSGDAAIAGVVGAIILLAVLGTSIVYVNAFHVPRQGATMELEGREEAESALRALASRLAGEPGTVQQDLPLKPPRQRAPLLQGVVLSPVRVDGELRFDPSSPVVRVSHVTDLQPDVSPDDPTRVADAAAGTMRVYAFGNATAGRPLGALGLTQGGAYLEPATYGLEGGAVIARRGEGSSLVAPPALVVARGGTDAAPLTIVTWRIPVLVGSLGGTGGHEAAQVSLTPGPLARAGAGELVHNTTIEVQTTAMSAWAQALQGVAGGLGTVTMTPSGAADNGTVTLTIASPVAGQEGVVIDYSAVRYSLSVTERSSR